VPRIEGTHLQHDLSASLGWQLVEDFLLTLAHHHVGEQTMELPTAVQT
jgi:hypothetical protein